MRKLNFTYSQNTTSRIDSYEQFLNNFDIDKDDFYKWGISSTIFPPIPSVEENWKLLKERILSNQIVYIRGYGRDAHGTQLYIDLYRELFGNNNICKDPTNNAEPHKIIQRLTGLKRNSNIFNYQVSHIFGHTKNVFLFEAPWNICYTPKIMDPFTGHETKGIWPEEYKKLLLIKAVELYKPFIEDYNQLLDKYHVTRKTDEYIASLKGIVPDKELKQFAKDAHGELSPIIL